jgi:carboxyl-terminal processing protease
MRKGLLVLLGGATGLVLALLAARSDLVSSTADARSVTSAENYHRLDRLVDALDRVRKYYFEKQHGDTLIKQAINGMLSDLEGSSYIDSRSLKRLEVCTFCEFAGVGLDLTTEHGLVKVVSVFDDMPASKAGLMAGDVITRIDNEPVKGLTFSEVTDKLRGRIESRLALEVIHAGQRNPVQFVLARDVVRVRPVRFHSDGGDVGYIRVATFSSEAADQLKKAISAIATQITPETLKGYVLDLRNTPTGLLDQAVSVADAFLENGEIVSIHHRKSEDAERFYATAGDLTNGKPLVVLINGGSASMAEVVAGALQDHKRATIIGTRSFGNGAVYTLIPLGDDNGAIRLATAHYVTPSGHVIQGRGIFPDVEVVQDLPDDLRPTKGHAQFVLQSYIPPNPKDDKALITAHKLLRWPGSNVPPTQPYWAQYPSCRISRSCYIGWSARVGWVWRSAP